MIDTQGGFASGETDANGVLQVRMNCVGTDGLLHLQGGRRVPPPPNLARYLLQPGDILFNNTNSPELVGKTAYFAGSIEPVTFSNHFTRIRVDTSLACPPYIAKWLTAERNLGNLRLLANQWVNQALIPIDALLRVELRLPSLPAQERAAAILDKADDLRRKRKEAIALADDLLRSTFLDMFGDPASNPKRWPTQPVADIGVVTTGNTPPRDVPDFYGDDIEWIKSDNINTPSNLLTRATEFLSARGRAVGRVVQAGSTLMTCIAGSKACIGNVALADRDVAFNQQINAVTAHAGIDHRFLYMLLLMSKPLVQGASTDGMKGMVSKGRLEALQLPVPPEPLRGAFGGKFDELQRTLAHHEQAHNLGVELQAALTAEAFHGTRT